MNDPAVRVRAVFRDVSLALMEWADPPLMSPRQYRRLELVRDVYRPSDKQGDVEPFDVNADWEENNR